MTTKFKSGDLVYYSYKDYFARVINTKIDSNPYIHQYSGYRNLVYMQKIFWIDGSENKRQKRYMTCYEGDLVLMDQAAINEWAKRIKDMVGKTKQLNKDDDPRLIDIK